MHRVRPRQNNPHKALLTPLLSLHGQVLFFNVVQVTLFVRHQQSSWGQEIRLPSTTKPMHRQWKVLLVIDSEKWKTLNNRTVEILFTNDPTLHLFPRVLHYIIEPFTPLDWQTLHLLYTDFRFVWTQKKMIIWFWYTYCLDHTNALFMKFYRFMRTTLQRWSTLRRNAAQAIPLENLASRTCEGLFQTISNSGQWWRHGQTSFISHQEFGNTHAPCAKSKTTCHQSFAFLEGGPSATIGTRLTSKVLSSCRTSKPT